MKIKKTEIKSYLKNLLNYNGVLIYGEDYSKNDLLCKEIVKNLSKTLKNNLQIRQIQYELLLEDHNLLISEFQTNDFFSNSEFKVFLIKDVADKANKFFPKILDEIKCQNTYFIFLASKLTGKSVIKNFFDFSRLFASIACYCDNDEESALFVSFLLKKHQIKFESNIVDFIVKIVGNERGLLSSEIEKLILYLGDRKELFIQDIKECCISYNRQTIYDLCPMFANKDPDVFCLLQDLLQKNEKIPTIIRYLQNYFMQISRIEHLINSGMSFDDAVSVINPPIFFQLVPIIKKQLNFWKEERLKQLISGLLMLEIYCKNFHKIDKELFVFFMNRVFSNNSFFIA